MIKQQFDYLNKKIYLFGTYHREKEEEEIKPAWYVIMPSSKLKTVWNLIMLILLLYTAVIVPYRVAFIDFPSTFMFYLEIFIDILFIGDLFINFFSATELGDDKYEI